MSVKKLLELTTVKSLGVVVLDGREHHIRPLCVSDIARLEAAKASSGEGVAALVDFVRLAIPTLDTEELQALELEVLNAIGDVVQRALAARAAEKEAALRASPLFAAS